MRIVAGRWRGRRIEAPAGDLVRPTADRVREAWLSRVQLDVPDARVLDLFAGSGALGLEALSRGARSVDFVESHPVSIRTIEANARLLAATAFEVHRADARRFVTGLAPEAYDLAFADPPYGQGHAEALAEAWLAVPFARVFGLEHESAVGLPEGGETRRYGTTSITIYRLPDA